MSPTAEQAKDVNGIEFAATLAEKTTMSVSSYRAVTTSNRTISGLLNADTPRQARDLLRESGHTIQSIQQVAAKPKRRIRWLDGLLAHRRQELVTGFARQLAALVAVGVRLTDALQTIARPQRGRFQAVLRDASPTTT